ncbi:hypothetical protein MTBLM5_50190 [Magnetospirillum sp. LM-5]|nr:hypothetical protein MTBLM5_50190 [Magnetospirillum sp. LM-5]
MAPVGNAKGRGLPRPRRLHTRTDDLQVNCPVTNCFFRPISNESKPSLSDIARKGGGLAYSDWLAVRLAAVVKCGGGP